jgi:alpha-2-macroglobulin-like protein
MLVKKRFFVPLAILTVLLAGFVLLQKQHYFVLDPQTEALKKQVEAFLDKRPAERLYLQTDKTLYKPSETVWFQAFLREERFLKVATTSDILHVELINPKGNVEQEKHLILENGTIAGDFELTEGIVGGLYKIRAYTNVMKNSPLTPKGGTDVVMSKTPPSGAGGLLVFEKEITVQQVILPRLQMKLDFEREGYGGGEEVRATLELKNIENQALGNFSFSFVASLGGKPLDNGRGKTDATGKATIKFNLPYKVHTSDGLLNVLIDYQGQTESISRSVPITFDNIKVAFFPEGGDMIMNLENKIAFKATDEFGKGTDIQGFIESEKGKKIVEVASFHKGMGAFNFVPEIDTKYFLKITHPKGIAQKHELPEMLPVGYVLRVKEVEKDFINLQINSNVKTLNENEKLRIVTQIRGEIYQGQEFKATQGSTDLKISTENMPMGVAQITLFDSKGIARAERMVFVNEHKQLKVEIKTDKAQYLPREKVKMTISAKDERGLPVPAQLALAVTDEKILTFADDKQGNILTTLLLEADITAKIEEANFYLNSKEPKSKQALDFVLLTSGWRKFTWKEVADNKPFNLQFPAEKTVIGGVVYDNGLPIEKAQVLYGKLQYVHTDKNGRFVIKNHALYEPLVLEITLPDKAAFQYVVTEYGGNYVVKNIPKDRLRGGLVEEEEDMGFGAGGNDDFEIVADNVAMPKKQDELKKNIQEKPKVLAAVPAFAPKDMPQNELVADNKKAEVAEKQVVANKSVAAGTKVADKRMRQEAKRDVVAGKQARAEIIRNDDMLLGVADEEEPQAPAKVRYVRAREFPTVDYANAQNPTVRTDFRSTIFWQGNLQLDRKGKIEVEFYNSDEITSFKAVVEGVGEDGSVGRGEHTYFTQKAFSMDIKLPIEMTMGDKVSLPLTLINNTNQVLKGNLQFKVPKAFEKTNEKAQKGNTQNQNIELAAKEVRTILLDYEVLNRIGKDTFAVAFSANGTQDAFEKEVEILAKGFPSAVSFGGQELEKTFAIDINEPIEGTVSAVFAAYPNSLSDMLSGLEGMLRQPYGCFEQTSSTTYPNLLVMNYLKEADVKDEAIMAKASDLVKVGYNKLIGFETKEKGYEWFGGTPAHEALTAYGLMEFKDMQGVYASVDNAMIDRTTNWLLSRRDGKGGFLKSAQALDQFGRADEDITNAYIIYALAEAGVKDIDRELSNVYQKAIASGDAYQLGLAANALLLRKDASRAEKVLEKLLALQKENGAWTGKKMSITCSYGQALDIETTSLAILAILKSKTETPQGFKTLAGVNVEAAISKATKFLVGSRSYGSFGNTQSTILALKALVAHAKYSKKAAENGTVEIYVDNKKVAEQSFLAGRKDEIALNNWAKSLTKGKHEIKIKYVGCKVALPYSVGIQWNTNLPNSQKECKVSLKTDLASTKVKVGETVRLTTTLQNTVSEGLPMTLAIIGIPNGLSPQVWQLKELQEKKMVDFYETVGNNVIFYYRQMKPNETKTINLDLKAEIGGEYEASASSAFLYYTNEFKTWAKPERVKVGR